MIKYDYLIKQWQGFYREIDKDLKKLNDECFGIFCEKIKNDTLSLNDYAVSFEEGGSYLCNFIERTSAKIYGSARPGNMYNYGISLIGDKKEEEKFFINDSLLVDDANGETYKKEKKKREEVIYAKKDAENSFLKIRNYLKEIIELKDIVDIVKKIEKEKEKPINATQFLRKIIAMRNAGSYLYIYSDEVINTIYEFFCENINDTKTNIEKNHLCTIELKKHFPKAKDEDDNFHLIRLSRFIWEIFGSSIKLEAKNMILHGAPGTGKTYSIKNTIKNIILKQGGNIDKQLVFTQFHPSYSYEDFIDGIKPNGIDEKTGQLKFELKNGNFKELCRIATQKLLEERKAGKKDEELTKFFFVADEINRAELSRVFGELLICLEDDYRLDFDNKGIIKKEESLITLQNSSLDKNPVYTKGNKNYFGVPVNVYFIGTMNDIDRSVDSFDMALRRRFFWKEIRCNYDYIDSLFDNKEYRTICEELNEYITGYSKQKSNGKFVKVDKVKGKETLKLGTSYELGQAYFKNIKAVNNSEIEQLWNSKISPLLKEYLRAEYSQDEIINKLEEAKEIFTLLKENISDTNS
ncbi:AAA family ATPase [Aliarcobacter butzleri]|uniref:McrB family protein n=1 Tax=Aliarcobacter butzleri TaxID=28197 RepID=UPI0021B43B0A|nr:AAA family ATPase [Aliarcobacter butzleri]MCT7625044.1 AAA family ATPase [Aliarcobacter butzleri]